MLLVMGLACVISAIISAISASPARPEPDGSVSFRTMGFADKDKALRFDINVWYPAKRDAKKRTVRFPPWEVEEATRTAPEPSGTTAHRNIDLASFRVRHLMAGSSTNSLPVIHLNGDSLAKLSSNLDALKPFGLSDPPLSIEGEIARPDPLLLAPRYHILVDPKKLQPRHQ